MAAIVDRFIHILDESNLCPEDIEEVAVTPHAIGLNRMWRENRLRTEEDFGFHGPYLIACAAYRKKAVEYQDSDTRGNPEIREFMKKVKMLPAHHKDFGTSMLEDPITRVVSVEVRAKGKTYKETSRYIEWSWRPEEVRATDEDLVDKFNEIVSGFLPCEKIRKATDMLLTSEEVRDVNDLTEMLIP